MVTATEATESPAQPELKRPAGGPWLTTAEAADCMGISAQTLSNWRAAKIDGRPLSHKLGQRVWYKQSVIDQWIEDHRESE